MVSRRTDGLHFYMINFKAKTLSHDRKCCYLPKKCQPPSVSYTAMYWALMSVLPDGI